MTDKRFLITYLSPCVVCCKSGREEGIEETERIVTVDGSKTFFQSVEIYIYLYISVYISIQIYIPISNDTTRKTTTTVYIYVLGTGSVHLCGCLAADFGTSRVACRQTSAPSHSRAPARHPTKYPTIIKASCAHCQHTTAGLPLYIYIWCAIISDTLLLALVFFSILYYLY